MLIRNMTIEDIKQVAEIEAQCFSLPWSEKSLKDSLERKDSVFLVCEQRVDYEVDNKIKKSNNFIHDIGELGDCLPYIQNQNKENLQDLQNETSLSDKKIIGYIGMYISFEEGEITNVAVIPSERQKGVGNALLKSIKEIAVKQNLQSIVLEVRVSNRPAISLYEKNGFVSVGIRKNFYEKPIEDANIMICNNPGFRKEVYE